MIELQNVSKIFESGTRAVEDVSLEIREGETFGLVGTSGCGKTTTLKMINRLVEPTSGTVSINGEPVQRQHAESLRRRIGYVIQDVGLFPHYSVKENIATVPRLLQWSDREISSRVQELLRMVGLEPERFAGRSPDALSGGQKQRVGLARALAADPPVLLMDEPFGALDPITKTRIRREVSAIFRKLEKTIVLVTHDIFEAFEMCDRLCLLDDGHVQQIGTPQELLFQPANRFVRSFFESNRLQLELLSISIGELLMLEGENIELYWSPPISGEAETITDASLSLSAILEKMELSGEEHPVLIRKEQGQVTDSLGFTDLLNRFQQYKRELSERGGDG